MWNEHFKKGHHGFPFKMIGGVFIAVIFALLFGWVVVLLWNNILPELFQFPEINYWQAVGLLILAKLFFGRAGHGCKHHHPKGPHFKGGPRHVKPEDWEDFRRFWRERYREDYTHQEVSDSDQEEL